MSNCFAEFLQTAGLYDSIDITKDNIGELCDLIGGKVRISAYCVECKEMRVFSMTPIEFVFKDDERKLAIHSLSNDLIGHQNVQKLCEPAPGATARRNWYWTNWQTENATRVIQFPFVCAMDDKHHLDYIVQTDGNTMIKIGQFPSVADLSFPELDEYKGVIDESERKELRRAIGLHAQGIGVGSFVYLRRIFERILEAAKQQAESDGAVDLSNYRLLHIPERIQLLKGYLPDMISANPAIYGIVSKGIHELSEEDCIKYFPMLKDSIILTLKQWAKKKEEQEAENKLKASISKVAAELS